MKSMLAIVALFAGSAISAGAWFSGRVKSSFYNVGCGADSNKVLMSVNLEDGSYFGLISDAVLYPQASSLADLAVANGNPVQIYASTDTVSFRYCITNTSNTASSTAKRRTILGFSLDAK